MGNVNWNFPGLGAFFITFYQWLIGGPLLFICICLCAWGLVQLLTTDGRQGMVKFVGAPVVVIVMYALPVAFPALGTA